jgi:hypothetical protein
MFNEPVFNEGVVTDDPSEFAVFHANDKAIYDQVQDLLKTKVVGFPRSRVADDQLFPLAQALGAHGDAVTKAIAKTGQLVFHAVGDSGASKTAAFGNELRVFDHAADDLRLATVAERAAFFYHLGDVVYDFGESSYYYDQFYEPFRNYMAPVFALAGNHDSFIVPGTAKEAEPLVTFARNFCAEKPQVTREAGSLHRTAMTQPGVYFTLDAPFVRVVGLFSNALEDPGVISSQGGHWAKAPDYQLDFLRAQLARIKNEQYKGAVLLAVHHPPFSFSPKANAPSAIGNHGGSPEMLKQIDTICDDLGVYPHAVLSAHQHNYQRYTRTLQFHGKAIEVPFVVCGSGGHHINPIVQPRRGHPTQRPRFGEDVRYMDAKPTVDSRGLILESYDDNPADYGYLRITVTAKQLRIAFQLAQEDVARAQTDLVAVDLPTHLLVAN